MRLETQNSWLSEVPRPVLIAGPCSAETKEQLLSTAASLKDVKGLGYFRAGIWKPRTRPGGFEGVGDKAFSWLATVRAQTGLRPIVEVATPRHVEQALDSGVVDALWIGARSTTNPFAVQEIAESLKGIDLPVLVKNPVCPDLELWIGALERLDTAGIHKLAAVHRGFTPFGSSAYRNVPHWEIPIEMKRRFPDLPMLCDPSHIAGSRNYVGEISQRALDFGMDGLMIETHPDPEKALTDRDQQIKPADFHALLARLSYRTPSSPDSDFAEQLATHRQQLDKIDDDILSCLKRRLEVVAQIGVSKRRHNVTALQMDRWEQVLRERTQRSRELGLDPEFVHELYQLIHRVSLERQARDEKAKGEDATS